MPLDIPAGPEVSAVPGGVRRPPRARYPPIAEHGLIGDLHTVALVGTNGTIDWYCCPRFDSPSVFAALLDADRGGLFRIAPTVRLVVPPRAFVHAERGGDSLVRHRLLAAGQLQDNLLAPLAGQRSWLLFSSPWQ
jgi:Domain of unknown function (DUF5911)